MNFMYFLAILIGPLVKILYSFIGNYAVTMVVATLLLKLLLFPLSIHQQKSSAKMAVFQPLMNEIQQKYKNDPQKQQEELMKLQQEHGFNPMGGCMPMLLTMLVLFGFLGVVYYPVHYIFGVDNAAVKAACEAIGIATANTSTMQTALIQAIHNGAVIDPSIIPANIVAEIQNFNTSFFGMDMCDVPGFRFVPIAIFPAIAAVTMFISYFVTQKLSGMDAQMQGSMKVMMLVMNLMFVTFCFNAPVGFSLYYGVSNLLQIGQSYVTYKIYSPEKFKAQYEAELAAKRAERKKKRTVTVEQNGEKIQKEVTLGEANKLRLELARQREAELYKAEGGKLPEALLKMNWPEKYDPEEWTRRINGFFWADTKIGNRLYKKGDLVPAFGNLQADGSTSSLNWLYTGSYTEDEGNKSKRRDPTQTPMQAAIGLYPNWSWCWPVNRRILYNRASVDLNGKPYNPKKAVIEWDGKKWVGDVPDGPWAPQADTKNGKLAYIMTTDGYAQLYGPGRLDGPFPEHYEPAETPVAQHPFSKQLSSPVYKFHTSDMDKLAKAADPKYPIVLTTYSMTEHWCGGGETRNVPNLLEAEPQLYVEMSPELAKEKGIANGDGVIVESARGRVEAIAMVTVRIRPFKVMGKTVHLIGMPFAYGWTTPKCGDSTNRLTIVACDPNTTIPEAKACCVNIRKADKLTEIA